MKGGIWLKMNKLIEKVWMSKKGEGLILSQAANQTLRPIGGVLVERADQPSRKIQERGCEDTRHGES